MRKQFWIAFPTQSGFGPAQHFAHFTGLFYEILDLIGMAFPLVYDQRAQCERNVTLFAFSRTIFVDFTMIS